MSEPQDHRPPPLGGPIWRAVAGLGITQIIGWGSTYYLLTILARPMVSELGISPPVASSGLSILMVCGAVFGPLAGRTMDVHGARVVMAAGSAVAAAGLLLLSLAAGPVSYLAAWLAIGLSAPLILYPAAFTALTQAAPGQARRAITLLTLPGGLASTVFWPLTDALLTQLDWREVCVAYALANLLICLPIHLAVIPPRRRTAVATATGEPEAEGLPAHARRKAFVLFAAMLAFNGMFITGILNQFMDVMRELGQKPENIVFFGMVFGISQLSARLVDMVFGTRYDPLRTGLVVNAGFLLAVLILAGAKNAALAGFAFALLIGASNGVLTIVRGTLVLQLFGIRGYGASLGTVIVAQGLFGAAAPVLLSGVLEGAGGAGVLIMLAVVSGSATVAMGLLFRHASRVMNEQKSSAQ